MKPKLILIPILFFIIISLASAQELLIEDFDVANATTISSTFVDILNSNFQLNLTTDVTVISTLNAELENTGGGTDTGFAEFRILLDSIEIARTSIFLDALTRKYMISVQGSKLNVAVGSHNIQLQHKISGERLNSEEITFIINTNTLLNTSLIKSHIFPIQINRTTPFTFIEMASGTFTTNINQDIISFLNANTTSKSTGKITLFYEIDGIKANHIFYRHTSILEPFSVGNVFRFTNISSGLHTWKIFARETQDTFAEPYTLHGELVFIETKKDNIELNNNFTLILNSTVGTTFEEITNLKINILENSDILAYITTTSKQTIIDVQIKLDNLIGSKIRSRNKESDLLEKPVSLITSFKDLTAGIHTISVLAKTDSGTATFLNLSLLIIEINDYDENIVIPPNQFKAAENRSVNDTPFLIKKLDFADSSTASDTYVSIGSFQFNINISDTNVNFFSNLEAELTAVGPAGSGIASWRILIDGETVSEVNREFLDTSNGDIGSVVLFGQSEDLSIGSHGIEFQHKTTGEQINSRDITFFINQDTLFNNSRIKRNSFDFNISYSTTLFIEIASGNFDTISDQDIFSIIDLNISLPTGQRQEFFYQLDGINSGHFKRLVNQLPENIHLGYVNLFENVAAGSHTWRVFARNIPFTVSTFTGTGKITFVQTNSDGLTLNSNSLVIEEQKNIVDVFLEIARLEIDVVDQSDIAVLISGTFDTNTTNLSVNRNTLIDFEIRTPVGNSFVRNINLLGSNGSDTGKRFYNFFFSDIFENFNSGKNNISLFVKASPEKLNIINLTFSLFEVEDYDLLIQVPIPPVVTIISPLNNTRNNTHPINITFVASNDEAIFLDCTLRNASTVFDQGTFSNNVTGNLLLDTGLIEIDQRFDLEVICFDNGNVFNLSSSAFLSNLTLDNVLPIITPINPTGRFNKDILTIIPINALCNDNPVLRFNVTIFNSTDQIFSEVDNTPVGNQLEISSTLDITNVGSGTYTVRHTCSDPHTKKSIPDYNINKNISVNSIKIVTPSLNEFEIKYSTPPKNPVSVLSYGWNKLNDRYTFWYILNASEDGTEYDWNFEIENNKFPVQYIPESPYKAHFIMENNWLDFEFEGDESASWIVTLNANGNYEIEITTTKTTLNFTSFGELNTAILETEFQIFFIKQIRDDTFNITTCPLENLQRTILFIFFILLSFGIMILGFNWQVGLIGFFGAMMLLILSVFVYSCIIAVGMILSGLAIIMISFFVIKGTRNFI